MVDGAADLVDELAQRQVESRLVLVADERQVAVEDVPRALLPPGAEVAVDRNQDLREAEAGHHAHDAALQLLEHEVAAEAAEDAIRRADNGDRQRPRQDRGFAPRSRPLHYRPVC